MPMTIAFTLALAVSLGGVSLACATEPTAPAIHPFHHHHRAHHRVPAAREAVQAPAAQPAPAAARPSASPPVQNDSDGLSRDPEDCMKGCVDTTD
ncbi:MAG TPA: hypothetical protein VMB83_10270 [Roseiarcus sp.]|nr:hypothetical protein [Roseiarcus sp.]